MKVLSWTTLVALSLLTPTWANAAETIFHYRVNDTDASNLPDIPSVEGSDGLADDVVTLSDDIPTVGVPAGAGNRSIDNGITGGIVSPDVVELGNDLIADEGGFTYELWFNWSGFGDINSIIDYSGTEKLVIDVNQGTGNELRMRVNSDGNLDTFIAEVEPETWYYTAVVFDTEGNELGDDNSITGVFHLYLDGEKLETSDEVTITEFGDSLNRPIGVSKHPLGFARDFYEGLVYEPRVSLGALSPEELLYTTGGGGGVDGDFNGSGDLDLEDIDLLTAAVAAASTDLSFDLTSDGAVNSDDVVFWTKDLANSWVGDSNLDGEFNSGDFVAVFTPGKFESGNAAVWSEGDWNADGVFDSSDFVFAFTDGGYEQGPRTATAAVPEPTGCLLLLLGSLTLIHRRR